MNLCYDGSMDKRNYQIELDGVIDSLPEGTGIFICNMFYREIEEQLREMGVTGGIEYFNDEYLPVISMKRLKGL